MIVNRKFLYVLLVIFLSLTTLCINAQSKPWLVPQAALSKKNPLGNDAATIKIGKTVYVANCSPCHGTSGKGDGPAAAALNPKPANHTSAIIQAEPDGSLFYKISEGRTPMPQYKAVLTENQRWALVSYIKTLGKK